MASEQPGPEAVAGVGEEGGSGDVQTVRGQVSKVFEFSRSNNHVNDTRVTNHPLEMTYFNLQSSGHFVYCQCSSRH